MKLFKSLLIISAVSVGGIATAHHPLVTQLKTLAKEHIGFFKKTDHTAEDVRTFVTNYETLKTIAHLSFKKVDKKELSSLTTTFTYLDIVEPLYTLIKDYPCDVECIVSFNIIKRWCTENPKRIHIINELIHHFCNS